MDIKDKEALNASGLTIEEESEFEHLVEDQVNEELEVEEAHKQEVAELKDKLLRVMADFDNYKKRAEREKGETADYAITKFSRDMLSVSDNLDRALQSLNNEKETMQGDMKSFIEGVEMTSTGLLNTLEKYNIRKIDPKGEKFDHNFHQAMFDIETDESPEGTIMQVMQPGYVLKDRLLRPALVGVAKPKSDSSE